MQAALADPGLRATSDMTSDPPGYQQWPRPIPRVASDQAVPRSLP